MYSLTISFGPVGTLWRLLFKTEEKATEAMKILINGEATITDDFGQQVHAPDANGIMLENLDESMLAHKELALHEGRTRAKIMSAAQGDPVLRAASMNQGPAVFNPMNGGFPRQ